MKENPEPSNSELDTNENEEEEGQVDFKQPEEEEEEEEIDPRTLLTHEQIEQFKELFTILDVQGKGKLPVKLIGQALRTLGLNPRQSDIKKHIAKIDPENKGWTDFAGFLLPVAQRIDEIPESAEDIIEAFKTFDPENTGIISANTLVEYLTTLGEKLEDFEIEAFIKAADSKGDGNIDYKEFTLKMMGVPKKAVQIEQESKKQKKKK